MKRENVKRSHKTHDYYMYTILIFFTSLITIFIPFYFIFSHFIYWLTCTCIYLFICLCIYSIYLFYTWPYQKPPLGKYIVGFLLKLIILNFPTDSFKVSKRKDTCVWEEKERQSIWICMPLSAIPREIAQGNAVVES